MFGFALVAVAAQAGNVSYTYDVGGRLLAAYDGNGNLTNYQYDRADNIIAILTSSASSEAVFGYSPDHGAAGTNVTIYGNDFGSSPTVTFNGASASVVSSNGSQIVVTLQSPSTGPVVVTSSTGSATGPIFFVP